MGDLHELIDLNKVGLLFGILAIFGPAFGIIIGAAYGRTKSDPKAGALFGLIWGSLGVLNWLLWRAYNAVTDRNGLDTVKNLFINLVLFVIVGTVIGATSGQLYLRYRLSRHSESSADNAARLTQDK